MDKDTLIRQLCPPLDRQLIESLVAEFNSEERRFVLGDWEPATLDGGQFAEITSRILYHADSGTLNRRKSFDDCLKYIEDHSNQNNHSVQPHRTALHLGRILRAIYKFRSQRGAIHIDPDYTANELDSTLIIGLVRWVMAELLRVFWKGAQPEVARMVREIVRFPLPAVLTYDDMHLVLRTDCTVEEEILILLHNAGEAGLTRTILGRSIPKSAPSVSRALATLKDASHREVVERKDGRVVLTPRGSRRIQQQLAPKLKLE